MTDDATSPPARLTSPRPCPICGRPARDQHRPFCSRRCREVDLARWFAGAYRLPAGEADEEGGDPT